MNRIFKYFIASIIMGVTVFYAVYYTKGEYNYMAIPTAFLVNGPIYFSRKKTQFSKLALKINGIGSGILVLEPLLLGLRDCI